MYIYVAIGVGVAVLIVIAFLATNTKQARERRIARREHRAKAKALQAASWEIKLFAHKLLSDLLKIREKDVLELRRAIEWTRKRSAELPTCAGTSAFRALEGEHLAAAKEHFPSDSLIARLQAEAWAALNAEAKLRYVAIADTYGLSFSERAQAIAAGEEAALSIWRGAIRDIQHEESPLEVFKLRKEKGLGEF
jgi:hypothetical protein